MRGLFKLIWFLMLLAAVAVGAAALLGSALPRDHVASRSARIDTPRHLIYDVLVTPESYPEWRTGVTRVERIDSDRFTEHGPDGAVTFRIIDRQPPERVVIAVDDPEQVFTGTWTYELVPEGSGEPYTRLKITERGSVPNPVYRAIASVMMSPGDSMEAYLKDLGRRFGQTVTLDPRAPGER